MEQNLLQEPSSSNIMLDNNTLVIESKANVIEDDDLDIDNCR